MFSPPNLKGGFALPTLEGVGLCQSFSVFKLLARRDEVVQDIVPYCTHGVKSLSVKNVSLPFYSLPVLSISLHFSFPLLDQSLAWCNTLLFLRLKGGALAQELGACFHCHLSQL